MPSGTMAQPIALRIWSDRRGIRTVAFHPTCHLEIHEEKGYERLHGLHGKLVGDPNRLITLDDLEGDPRAGGRAAPGAAAARDRRPPALLGRPRRPGRVGPGAGRRDAPRRSPPLGVAALLRAAARRDRGTVRQRLRLVLQGARWDRGCRARGRRRAGRRGARLAAAPGREPRRRCTPSSSRPRSRSTSGSTGYPSTPTTPARSPRPSRRSTASRSCPTRRRRPLFHLLLRGDRERLADAALQVAEERKVFLFADPSSTTSPSWQRHEVMVGEVTLALEPAEVADLYAEVLARAAAPRPARKRRARTAR